MTGSGLCGCGCGEPTKLAKQNRSADGDAKGHPRAFLRGHNKRVQPKKPLPHGQYRFVGKLKKAHRLRAERALGKPLPPKAVVHHADGSTDEHAPLVICENQAYHLFLHTRMRIQAAGGDPNTQRICERCHQLKSLDELTKTGNIHNVCKPCAAASMRRWREKKRRAA